MPSVKEMAENKFRAIIVGCGPVGLAVANGLKRADLDFVIIERYPTIMSDSGAGIMLWPHTVRVFDQLGILPACEDRYIRVDVRANIRLDGTKVREGPIFKYLADNHGYPCMNFPRPALVQTLLDGLGPSETRIRTGVAVDDIEMTSSGVRVRLSDGSVEEGSLVIGADGVHSQTRGIMQRLAKEAGNDIAKDEEPIVSHYQIMYGRARHVPNAEIHTFYETHGTHRSSQISADEKRMHFGIYRKLPSPTTELKKEYSEEEVAEFVKAFSDVMVMPNLSFPELYQNCEWTKLVNQHEGLMKHWYHGRIVLVGDSAAQMTAAAGMGVNNGIQSAIVLVNKLHEMLSKDPNPHPDTLERVLKEYEEDRREGSRQICDIAARMIRVNTWDSYLSWFMGDVFFPWLMSEEKLCARISNGLIRNQHKFNFIQADLKSGTIPWADL